MSKNIMYKITSFTYDIDRISAVKERRTSFFSLAKDIVEHEIKYRSDDKDITLTYSDDEIFIYTDSKGHIRYMIQEFSVEITDDTVDFSTSYTDHLIWDNNAKNSTVSVTIEHYDRSYAYAKEEE